MPFVVAAVCVLLGGCGETAAQPAPVPATERPLLGAPDLAGPTHRGVFLEDPKGQVERIAAGGHFVAWSIRTPADKRHGGYDDVEPKTLPRASKVVVADERTGTTLSVDLGRRWVSTLRMIRGAGGPAEPQLAIESCRTLEPSSCTAELLTLTPEPPLRVTARTRGAAAEAAVDGRLDSGRVLGVASRGKCSARLTVREVDGRTRTLPALPARDPQYRRCRGLNGWMIHGRYAFASVRREDPRHNLEADFFYALDLSAAAPRWAEVARPYNGTDGGAALDIGPGLTDGALYWETYDSVEERIYSLTQVALPRDIETEATAATPNQSEPIAPDKGGACDIAATDAALYELANPRCALDYGEGSRGEIRRLVNPEFRPQEG
ncbi:hypothetical protein [Solirubrobacter deserti]|uniref:Lipoprotein n=1 Tax=Solirubrobacter deserti TaxID=2282478 RepID=A0ABT4RF26_9ACTN|nr:hypothetical protein [Solirubrobacter deserti]MDA0136956.1 hypothetical protein [Solirubrobacter deserti]